MMYSTLQVFGVIAALASGGYARNDQSSSTASTAAAATTAAATTAAASTGAAPSAEPADIWATSEVLEFVTQFGPATANLKPSQVSKLYQDINSWEDHYLSVLPEDPAASLASASVIPTALATAIEQAEDLGQIDPTDGWASLSVLVSALPESSAILAFESSYIAAASTWTSAVGAIIASNIGTTVAPQTTTATSATKGSTLSTRGTSSKGTTAMTAPSSSGTTSASTSQSSALAAAPTAGSGVVMGAVAAAAGVVGMAML